MAARDKVLTAAFALPPQERAELIGELAESLVPLTSEEEESILVGLRQIDEGKTVSGDEFFRRMRALVASPPPAPRRRPRSRK